MSNRSRASKAPRARRASTRPRYPSDAVREAERHAGRLRRSFAEELASQLAMPAMVHRGRGGHKTCWLDPYGDINHARLTTICSPEPGYLSDPLILRISINYMTFDWKHRVRKRMGWADASAFPPDPSPLKWRYELSLLPDQVSDFVPWIAALADAQAQRDGALIPEPPYPCYFWGGQSLHCAYAWTQTGWETMRPVQERSQRERDRRLGR